MDMWKKDVYEALKNLHGQAKLEAIYEEVRLIRVRRNAPQPLSLESIVRRTLQEFSSSTTSYRGKEDLFESIDGIGKGVWGLRHQRSLAKSQISNSKKSDDISIETLRARAYKAAAKILNNGSKKKTTYTLERNKDIKAYAIKRSKGICECCGTSAPFKDIYGQPFLEIHHMQKLSKDGLDSPSNVAAITPNCHKRIHHSSDGEEIDKTLIEKILKKERVYNTA